MDKSQFRHASVYLKRGFFAALLPMALLLPMAFCGPQASAADWPTQAFEAKQTSEVLKALQLGPLTPAPDLRIDAPQKAENGAVVQVELQAAAPAGQIHTVRLLADANPTPLIASFSLAKHVLPHIVTRVKLAQSGDVLALQQGIDGQVQQQRRGVVVLEDGCSNSEREEPFASSMKMRARLTGDTAGGAPVTELKIIILHPMRTGRSKNEAGQPVPAHFMQTMQVLHRGQVIVDAQTGTAISRNPYFTFYLTDAQAGDNIEVRWQDNLGFQGQGQVVVSQ